MKTTTKKLVSALLAIVLVLGTFAVAAFAAEAEPLVKISSIVNVEVGSEGQEITVSTTPGTEIENAVITLKYAAAKLKNVGVEFADSVNASADASTAGSIVLTIDSAKNETAEDAVLCTISFDFASSAKGLIDLEYEVAGTEEGVTATINGNEFSKTGEYVVGEESEDEAYKDYVSIALKGAVEASSKNAPDVGAILELTLVPYVSKEGKPENTFAGQVIKLELTGDIYGKKLLTAEDLDKFVTSNAAKINTALKDKDPNTTLTAEDFDFDATSVLLNGGEIASNETFDNGVTYKYTAKMNQLEPVLATVRVVLRSAMKNRDSYHGSNIPDYDFYFTVKAGKAIHGDATILAYMKEYIELYNARKGDLDMDDDGQDDVHINGIFLNQHIKDYSGDQYDLGDFVLDESVVGFNGAKIGGGETYSTDESKNIYTVYFDQVNVPATVLNAAAEALGSIDYSQFVKAQVVTINEAIGAFQAFADSLVNAEWPEAEDVEEDEEEEKKEDSKSPATGSTIGLGVTLAAVVALSASAIIIKKKEN